MSAHLLALLGLSTIPLLLRPLIVVLHELGHATAALLLTRQSVTVYLGLPRTGARTYHLRLGPINVGFTFTWKQLFVGGYCVPVVPIRGLFPASIFVLAGPLTPLTVTVLIFHAVTAQPTSDLAELGALYFLVAGLMDAFANLRPNPRPVVLPTGQTTFNDGQQLLNIWRHRRARQLFEHALQHYQQQNYARAGSLFQQLLPMHPAPAEVLGYATSAWAQHGDYQQAFLLGQQLREQYPERAHEPHLWFTHALAASRLDRHVEALDLYSELLVAHPDCTNAYLNRGFTHHLLGDYAAALADFDHGLLQEPDSAYALANRGLAHLKLNHPVEALADLERARELAPDNAYVPRSWGIYHLERGEAAQAVECFRHAQLLDPENHGITQLLQQAQHPTTATPST